MFSSHCISCLCQPTPASAVTVAPRVSQVPAGSPTSAASKFEMRLGVGASTTREKPKMGVREDGDSGRCQTDGHSGHSASAPQGAPPTDVDLTLVAVRTRCLDRALCWEPVGNQ